MNLWVIFSPHILIKFIGIQVLPVVAFFLYLYVLYALIKYSTQRIHLIIFLLLSFVASSFIFLMPGRFTDYPIAYPLILLLVILMPLGLFIFHLLKKNHELLYLWGITTLAAIAHSYSWALFMHALARS